MRLRPRAFVFAITSKSRSRSPDRWPTRRRSQKLFAEGRPLWLAPPPAGVLPPQPLRDTAWAATPQETEIPLPSAILGCRPGAPFMRGPGGRIVNAAARPALKGRPGGGRPAYTACKAGVAALTA